MRPSLIILGTSALLAGMLGALSAPTTAHAGPAAPADRTFAALSTRHANVLERRVVRATNRVRARHGCPRVHMVRSLRRSAGLHSLTMASHEQLSHQFAGEPSLYARAVASGYTGAARIGENIAYGYRTANGVVRAWLNSPEHRHNLLNCRWRAIGVGLAESSDGLRWWTQDFGRR